MHRTVTHAQIIQTESHLKLICQELVIRKLYIISNAPNLIRKLQTKDLRTDGTIHHVYELAHQGSA